MINNREQTFGQRKAACMAALGERIHTCSNETHRVNNKEKRVPEVGTSYRW